MLVWLRYLRRIHKGQPEKTHHSTVNTRDNSCSSGPGLPIALRRYPILKKQPDALRRNSNTF
jgi:hypothetical protein